MNAELMVWSDLFLDEGTEGESSLLDEALFAFRLISERHEYQKSAKVLDLGCGSGLLALLMALDGKRVVGVDPYSSGFELSHSVVSSLHSRLRPEHLPATRNLLLIEGVVDQLEPSIRFDLVFAFMISEHVPNYGAVLEKAAGFLSPGGSMVIISPNYLFPYEPHFHSPTLGIKRLSKSLVFRLGKKLRAKNPVEFWRDLSWPTTLRVVRLLENQGLTVKLTKRALDLYIQRLFDEKFLARKTHRPSLARSVRWLAKILRLIPLKFGPIIDATGVKSFETG